MALAEERTVTETLTVPTRDCATKPAAAQAPAPNPAPSNSERNRLAQALITQFEQVKPTQREVYFALKFVAQNASALLGSGFWPVVEGAMFAAADRTAPPAKTRADGTLVVDAW